MPPKAKAPKRHRATKKGALERRPGVVQAALQCPTPKPGPKAVPAGVWPHSGGPRYPKLSAAGGPTSVRARQMVFCEKLKERVGTLGTDLGSSENQQDNRSSA